MARQRHNAAFITGSILGGVGGAAAALWKTPKSGPELRAMLAERLGGAGGGSAATPTGTSTDASTGTGVTASTGSSNVSGAWNATRPTRASVAGASRASIAQVSRVSKASRDSLASATSKGWDIWNATTSPETRSFGGRALAFVENATAPIVGVKLGQSARNAGSKATDTDQSGSADPATAAGTEPAPVAVAAPVAPVSAEHLVSSTPPVEPARAGAPVAPVQRERVVSVSSPAPPVAPVDSSASQVTVGADDSGIGHVASTEELVTPVVPDQPEVTTGETGSGTGSFTDFPDFEADKRPR